MRFTSTLGAMLAVSTLAIHAASLPQPLWIRQDQAVSELSNSSIVSPSGGGKLTNLVNWDNYSLSVLGQRVFVLSGEFHPWRLPSPGLWQDIVQKVRRHVWSIKFPV